MLTCCVTVKTIQFNKAKMLPDVVLETNIGPSSMNVLPPGVGFRYCLHDVNMSLFMCSCSLKYYVYKTHIKSNKKL